MGNTIKPLEVNIEYYSHPITYFSNGLFVNRSDVYALLWDVELSDLVQRGDGNCVVLAALLSLIHFYGPDLILNYFDSIDMRKVYYKNRLFSVYIYDPTTLVSTRHEIDVITDGNTGYPEKLGMLVPELWPMILNKAVYKQYYMSYGIRISTQGSYLNSVFRCLTGRQTTTIFPSLLSDLPQEAAMAVIPSVVPNHAFAYMGTTTTHALFMNPWKTNPSITPAQDGLNVYKDGRIEIREDVLTQHISYLTKLVTL